MRKKLKEKINEALSSVLPITIIVLILSFTTAPMPIGTLMLFLFGAVMLIVGMGFFSLGVDMSMMPMGDGIGAEMAKNVAAHARELKASGAPYCDCAACAAAAAILEAEGGLL